MKRHLEHLQSSLPIMKKTLEILKAELEEMKPTVTIDNIGQFVKKEIEVMELEERIKKAKEELN